MPESSGNEMVRGLGTLLVASALLTGCTQVQGDDAREKLDESQLRVDRQILDFAKRLSADFGGSPTIVQREYAGCGSAPAEGLEYIAFAAFTPDEEMALDPIRKQAEANGWDYAGDAPAQGNISETLFFERGDLSTRVNVEDAAITIGSTGDCIRVTSEQANKLSGPID